MTKTAVRITALLIVLFLDIVAGAVYAQEATETAPETTTTEETATTTTTTPRTVSPEDIAELDRAQAAVFAANAIFNYVLEGIITDYRINVQTEVLNIKTGIISPRPPATQ